MSFCSNCGAQIENESAQFCTNCGVQIGVPVTNSAPIYEQPQPTPGYIPAEPVVQYKMKWFKFLIYFALFLGAFVNFVFGFNYISGGIYFSQSNGQVTADMVYSIYGMGLKALDVIYGIVLLVLAGFGIYTRSRLAKYKANAPMCVCILYGAGTVLTFIYNIALLAVTGLNQIFSVNSITSLIAAVVIILLNRKYFSKRAPLFVN